MGEECVETIDVCDLIEVERMIYNLELTLAEMQSYDLCKLQRKCMVPGT
ncbi:hypothetical protein MTCOM_23790 [Moorella thermoacetica]